MVLVDCGDTIEIYTMTCGGGNTQQIITKKSLLNAEWDPEKEEYSLPSGPVIRVHDFPTEIKREIERLRKENDMDNIQTALEIDLKRQRSSERNMLALIYAATGALLSFMALAVTYSQQAFTFVGLACLVIPLLFRDPFAKRFGPWLGLVSSEQLLFIRLRKAIDVLDRFVNEKRLQFLEEGVKLLDVSYLPSEIRTGQWSLLRRPAKQVMELLSNISWGIRPAIRKSTNKREYVIRDVLPRLRLLLPLLLEPDMELLDSWNEATRQKFQVLEDRRPLVRLRTGILRRPLLHAMLMSGVFLIAGYGFAAVAIFLWGSYRSGSVLQLAGLLALTKEWYYFLVGPTLGGLIWGIWSKRSPPRNGTRKDGSTSS
jgi:hypothetical protein